MSEKSGKPIHTFMIDQVGYKLIFREGFYLDNAPNNDGLSEEQVDLAKWIFEECIYTDEPTMFEIIKRRYTLENELKEHVTEEW